MCVSEKTAPLRSRLSIGYRAANVRERFRTESRGHSTSNMRTMAATLLAILLLAPCSIWGQIATGTISVIAEDPTQAVVPGAAVSVTNKNTGLTRRGQTDG